MAVAVLGHYDENNLIGMMRPTRRLDRRHYKKDSRFVLDLYTLTYDENESLDSLGDLTDVSIRNYESLRLQNRNEALKARKLHKSTKTFRYIGYQESLKKNDKDRRCESLNIQNSSTPWQRNNINLRNGRNNAMGYRYRRPSLQSRIQDGKNMQLYYVNEQSSETEDNHIEDGILSLPAIPQSNYLNMNDTDLTSLPTETESCHRLSGDLNTPQIKDCSSDDNNNKDYRLFNVENKENKEEAIKANINWNGGAENRWSSALRHDVCTSLKNMCEQTRRKLDIETRPRSDSPITCTIKTSLKKVGADAGKSYSGRQRLNRHMLTKMNADQLQVIMHDLHGHVEYLNEQLMKMLMERDELHMKRDSLLVDIEDLTAYLDAKQIFKKSEIKLNHLNENYIKNNQRVNVPNLCTKSLISGLRFNRFTSYIKNQ